MDMHTINTSYGYQSGYNSVNTSNNPLLTVSFLLFALALILIAYALYAWLLGRIFHKAGLPKTAAWIPFYNNWKLLELGDQKGYWSILLVIPIVSYIAIVFWYISFYRVGLKFGKNGWWLVLAIYIPIIWLAILAFDSSVYQPKVPELTESGTLLA